MIFVLYFITLLYLCYAVRVGLQPTIFVARLYSP